MTAKEKALQLVSMFHEEIKYVVDHHRSGINAARHCALVTVEQILEALSENGNVAENISLYWGEVRTEIKKL